MIDGKRLLLVDDDEIFLFTAGYALNRVFSGIEIVTCRNGEDALDRLTDVEPEAMFVDLNMPLMDGWELLDEMSIKYGQPKYPIIIVSSSIDPNDKKRAQDHALKLRFVEKPLTEDKLTELKLNLSA